MPPVSPIHYFNAHSCAARRSNLRGSVINCRRKKEDGRHGIAAELLVLCCNQATCGAKRRVDPRTILGVSVMGVSVGVSSASTTLDRRQREVEGDMWARARKPGRQKLFCIQQQSTAYLLVYLNIINRVSALQRCSYVYTPEYRSTSYGYELCMNYSSATHNCSSKYCCCVYDEYSRRVNPPQPFRARALCSSSVSFFIPKPNKQWIRFLNSVDTETERGHASSSFSFSFFLQHYTSPTYTKHSSVPFDTRAEHVQPAQPAR